MSSRWTAYDSVPRRRVRALARLVRPVLTPAFYPTVGVTPAYWWDGHPNFGDALTPWLFERYGRIAVHSHPRVARVAGVGSILEQLAPDFSGTVWGSGLLYGERCDLPQARYAAVRGHLTRRVQGIVHPVALGDPGLLVSRHASRPRQRWALGLVPHGMHHEHPDVQRFAATPPDGGEVDRRRWLGGFRGARDRGVRRGGKQLVARPGGRGLLRDPGVLVQPRARAVGWLVQVPGLRVRGHARAHATEHLRGGVGPVGRGRGRSDG